MTRLSEVDGCALLKDIFERAGFQVAEHYRLRVGDAVVSLDGYDEARGVGYEYITTSAGDRAELTPGVIAELEASMQRGERYVLLVDELDVADADMLRRASLGFLDALRARGRCP